MDETANEDDRVDLKSLDYVNVNDYLLCPICKSAFVKPVTTVCGHTFCSDCLHQAIEASGGQCPIDRRILNPDKDITRAPRIISCMADELTVCCPLSKECAFQGPRGLIQSHIDRECEFKLVVCCCGNNDKILRRDLQSDSSQLCPHKAKECPHCDERIPILEMAHHESECPGIIMTQCPECGVQISAHLLKPHLDTECPHITVGCIGADLGCTWQGRRIDQKSHTCLESKLATTLNSQQQSISNFTRENTRLKTQLERVLILQQTSMEEGYDPSTDYSLQAFTENEHLRRDLDRLHHNVADLEIRSNVLVMNESCRSKDEMQALWAAVNGLRHQIHFLLSERRVMQHSGLQQQQQQQQQPPAPPPDNGNSGSTHQVRTVKL